MSVDSPADDVDQPAELPCAEIERQEGITTTRRTHRKPASHGSTGAFVLNDRGRPAEDVGVDVPEYRNIPDGSAYQHARASWYAGDVEPGEPVVLTTSYNPSWSDREDELGVILTPSRSHAGQGEGDDYTAWYKYDVTIRQLDDDGELTDRTPAESLNLKLYPQVQGLVKKDGEPLTLPYGAGTRVQVQTTWVETTDEVVDRALDLLEHALAYKPEQTDVNPESVHFWKAEAHLRLDASKTDDVVHTIRQSTELLARNAAEVDETAEHDGNKWLEAKIKPTEDWHLLGFPDLDVPILLKLYYPEDPDNVPFPFDQPKLEAAVAGKEKVRDENGELVRRAIPGERLEEVLGVLREIVCTHLTWADVGPEDLVADDFLDGAAGEPYEFMYPEGRRSWLQDHFENLVPEIYREATKANTTLIYDILSVVSRRGTATYEELMRETGGSYRSVRRHVARLEEDVGGPDEPGILRRVRDACTFVAFSARALEDDAEDVLDEINPDDTIEDQRQRAEERREERQRREEERQARASDDDQGDGDVDKSDLSDDDGRDDLNDDHDGELWRTFRDLELTGEQLGAALDQEYVDGDDVRIRTGPYDWIAAD